MVSFKIIRGTIADRARIASFLRESYYKNEPFNRAMGKTDDDPSEDDMNHSLKSLPEGKSLMAVTHDKKIIGVAINGEVTNNEVNVRQKLLEECKCKDFATFLKFWVHVERTANFWKNTDETKAFDVKLLAVDSNTRNKGVGMALGEKSQKLAREEGYKVLRADCSNYYAGKISELVGMTCVYELNFDDYKDENGRIVFNMPPPHSSLRIFMQKF